MLSLRQLEDYCLVNDSTHRKCRYLAQDELDWSKYYCLKKNKQHKDQVDKLVEDWINECAQTGKDPLQANIPMGDECPGYLMMKHVEQGYDCP